MTNEELVREANRRYPPGTSYWNLSMNGEKSNPQCNIKDLPVAPEGQEYTIMKDRASDGSILIGINGYGWVYTNHKWAEIESLPIINNYQIY